MLQRGGGKEAGPDMWLSSLNRAKFHEILSLHLQFPTGEAGMFLAEQKDRARAALVMSSKGGLRCRGSTGMAPHHSVLCPGAAAHCGARCPETSPRCHHGPWQEQDHQGGVCLYLKYIYPF